MRDRATRRRRMMAAALLLIGGLLGCSQSPPPEGQEGAEGAPKEAKVGDVRVTEFATGRELAADGTLAPASKTNSFWTTDAFYVAVKTEGSGPDVKLKAKWMGPNGGTVAHESEKTITPKGPMETVLEAKKPERWEAGDYKVEVFLNDISAGTQELTAR